MTETAGDGQKALQLEVQRLLGRCILRLQQYEGLLKAIVASGMVTANVGRSGSAPEVQGPDTNRKTLGMLVGMFTGTHLVPVEDKGLRDDAWPEDDGPDYSFRWRIGMTEEDHAATVKGLARLVTLRNHLVHHFLDTHDLATAEGCRRAQDALRAAGKLVDKHLLQLRDWAGLMEQARQVMAEAWARDAVHEWLATCIPEPDPPPANCPEAGKGKAHRQTRTGPANARRH